MPPMGAPLLKRRFTVEEYQKLGEVGILGEDDRVEIHRAPGGSGYRDVSMPRPDERFSPVAFPDLTITLRDLLG